MNNSIQSSMNSIFKSSIEIDKNIAKSAMERMQKQRDAKIIQKTQLTAGGNDGSQTT